MVLEGYSCVMAERGTGGEWLLPQRGVFAGFNEGIFGVFAGGASALALRNFLRRQPQLTLSFSPTTDHFLTTRQGHPIPSPHSLPRYFTSTTHCSIQFIHTHNPITRLSTAEAAVSSSSTVLPANAPPLKRVRCFHNYGLVLILNSDLHPHPSTFHIHIYMLLSLHNTHALCDLHK